MLPSSHLPIVLKHAGNDNEWIRSVRYTRYRLDNIGQTRLEKNVIEGKVEQTVMSKCVGFLYMALVVSEKAPVVLIGN
jgi:hypothetical protein